MNLKVAHLVSVQFGIFVGIVSCLVVSRFEFAKPRHAAEMREPAADKLMSEPENQRAYVADHPAEAESAEPAAEQPAPALPNEYSPEAAERYRALAEKLYYEQIAPRRTASSSAANSSISSAAPAYTETVQEPAVVQIEDPAPQTVAYVQPTEVIVYPQPVQFVAFARPRRFVNRCRPAPRPETFASNPYQRPGGADHLKSSLQSGPPPSLGTRHRRNTGGPPCPSPQGFAHRGKR